MRPRTIIQGLCLLIAIGAASRGSTADRSYVSLGAVQGVLTRPQSTSAPHVAIVYDNGPDSPMHPMCTAMAERGFLTWCAIATADTDTAQDWTQRAAELKAVITHLRQEPGIRAVVLYGHSGGGALASFYQATAENGVAFCQAAQKLSACSAALAGLPKADGVVFADAHPGMDVMTLRGLNPSLITDGSRVRVDPSLDPFSAANGFNPNGPSHYSSQFQHRYYAAQAAEMRRLTERALAIRKRIAQRSLANPADELIVIPGFGIATHLDELDPSIAVTMDSARPEPLLRNDGTVVMQKVHSAWTGRSPFVQFRQDLVVYAAQFLAMRAVRAQDSMSRIEWCSANSDTVCNAGQIHVPVLFIAAGASDFIADEERMFDASPARDKEYIVVEGASHSGAPCVPCEGTPGQYSNSQRNQYDYIAHWINRHFGGG